MNKGLRDATTWNDWRVRQDLMGWTSPTRYGIDVPKWSCVSTTYREGTSK
jgi:hypothetical protein